MGGIISTTTTPSKNTSNDGDKNSVQNQKKTVIVEKINDAVMIEKIHEDDSVTVVVVEQKEETAVVEGANDAIEKIHEDNDIAKPHYTFDTQTEPLQYKHTQQEAAQLLSEWMATGSGNGPTTSTKERQDALIKERYTEEGNLRSLEKVESTPAVAKQPSVGEVTSRPKVRAKEQV